MKSIIMLLRDAKGATSIEYAAIASLISIAAIAAIGTIGTSVASLFGQVPSF
jgi:pilus assembly protein Flp/PilA